MGVLLSLFGGSSAKLIAILAAVLGLIALGAWGQHKIDADKVDRLKTQYAEAQAAAVTAALAKQRQVDQAAQDAAAKEIAGQQALASNLKLELSHEPVVKTIARDCVPYGFLRLLDGAATRRPSSGLALPAGKSDDACAPVTWAAVGRSIVANYYTAHANADQLNALIDLLLTEQKVIAK